MTHCDELSERMPGVARRAAAWSSEEAVHLGLCADCAAEWRVVSAGATLHAGLMVDSERIAGRLLAQLREGGRVVPLRRLPWRHFVMGLAAAASVALAVWVPGRQHATAVVLMPTELGPTLPTLSSLTDEQFERATASTEGTMVEGVPGAVPHLGDLTERDLEQLSQWTETQ